MFGAQSIRVVGTAGARRATTGEEKMVVEKGTPPDAAAPSRTPALRPDTVGGTAGDALISELRERLARVCAGMPPAQFEALLHDIAAFKVRWASAADQHARMTPLHGTPAVPRPRAGDGGRDDA